MFVRESECETRWLLLGSTFSKKVITCLGFSSNVNYGFNVVTWCGNHHTYYTEGLRTVSPCCQSNSVIHLPTFPFVICGWAVVSPGDLPCGRTQGSYRRSIVFLSALRLYQSALCLYLNSLSLCQASLTQSHTHTHTHTHNFFPHMIPPSLSSLCACLSLTKSLSNPVSFYYIYISLSSKIS